MNKQFDELARSMARSVTRPRQSWIFPMRTIAAQIILAVSLLSAFTLQVYAQGGVPLWTNYYNGPLNHGDQPYVIAADGNGNVIVTGTSDAVFNGIAFFGTVKYSGAGVPLWTNRYHGSQPLESDYPSGIAVDALARTPTELPCAPLIAGV